MRLGSGDRTVITSPASSRLEGRAPRASGAPRVSIVIPTLNEAETVGEMLIQLAGALTAEDTPLSPTGPAAAWMPAVDGPVAEVIVVDDSSDRTPEVVTALARRYPLPLRLHHRTAGTGGLGGAVVEGIRLATGDWIVVMDADLQHPPRTLPELIGAGERTGADLVVASRYAAGGSRGGLSGPYRMLVSGASTLVTKAAFPRALRGITDPMSGFFAMRRSAIDVAGLRPLGYKILLELAVRCRPKRVAEVAYPFGDRFAGESKSSAKEGVRFLRHLAGLRLGSGALEMLMFGLIGLSGFIPNLVATWALTSVVGVDYVLSAAAATQVAILWNFALVDLFLFKNRRGKRLGGRLGTFFLVSNLDLLIRLPLLAGLVELAHMGYLLGTVITLLAMFVLRFTLTSRMVYPDQPSRGAWRVLDRWLRQAVPADIPVPTPAPTPAALEAR
jgi:dolichol-phosphate mannosyltransferase